MASKSKNTKDTKDSLPMANMFPCAPVIGNQEYVTEPPNHEGKLSIYKSQVLISYSIFEKTYALVGHMYDPAADLTNIKDLFPFYHRTKPIVSISGPLNL